MSVSETASKSQAPASFNWEDPLLLNDQLNEEERMVMDQARAFCQDKLMPRVLMANRNETFERSLFNELGEMGMLAITLPAEYGGAE